MRTLLAVVAVLSLAGCGGAADDAGPIPDCVTRCGLATFGLRESCGELQALETDVTTALTTDWPGGCALLVGVTVRRDRARVPNGGGLFEPFEGRVYRPTVYVAEEPLRTGGAFIHEVAHAMDWADGVGEAGLLHEGWEASGLLARMNAWQAAQ